ncbi:MAG: hypothetical protein EB070_08140 [Synechococcaceae bacterium WBA_2_066]|nr:hypothetical protein [Synechococcaceae bacterium WB6_1A_059]NBP32409.1 hypothetical protein [Synechococcaceae bacterium WB6_1B_055]NBP98366.1 hypothetical protein [Synechococcaceae bacterium WB6_3A_227]NBQ19385.1 hypothetical protein [Synechococcaceae bacterium WB5_2A_257]NBR44573.1 hypothetical protein [Synechococcaceae bacterium WB5_2B_268]NBY59536.1 hypothetical protein [Synechococcaceae bacterium LLD_019]NCU75866.1 hypothetical protein [Synechococcaceae bacterium WB7_1C_051]NCU91336.1
MIILSLGVSVDNKNLLGWFKQPGFYCVFGGLLCACSPMALMLLQLLLATGYNMLYFGLVK